MSDIPDSALVTNLFEGRYKAQIVRLAMDMDIFTKLHAGMEDISSLAKQCHCHPHGLRLLLNYLVSLGLVKSENERYYLSATGAFYFFPGRSSYVRDWIISEVDSQIWQGIKRAVKEGNPVFTPLPFASDAWMSIYVEGQLAKILKTWAQLEIKTQYVNNRRILDLASGCGMKTLALALTDPTVQVTLIDSKEVLTAAKYVIDLFNLAGQTKLVAGDALKIPLVNQSFDLIFIGQITYYWTEIQNRALLKRLYEVLVDGGILIVETMLPDSQDVESVTLYNFLLWANTGAALHRFDQYQNWMKEAGFSNIQRFGEGIIKALKI